MKTAIEFYGADHVMYGSDYPCWAPADALQYLEGVGLSAADNVKVLGANARRVLRLDEPVAPADALRERVGASR
jgi:aminocarboxymuconate-semialdehyde decarboxylase